MADKLRFIVKCFDLETIRIANETDGFLRRKPFVTEFVTTLENAVSAFDRHCRNLYDDGEDIEYAILSIEGYPHLEYSLCWTPNTDGGEMKRTQITEFVYE